MTTMAAVPDRRGFFERSELGRTLWAFRREVAWVGVFSMFANLLVLTPTVYMRCRRR